MCLVKNKLLIYDYLVGKLVDWDSEVQSCSKERSLFNLTNVKLMKCLYAVCLMSVKDKKRLEDTLFGLFDKFYAYPKGPVEFETYNNKSILLRYDLGYDESSKRLYLKKCDNFRTEQLIMFQLLDDKSVKPDDDTLNKEINKNHLAEYAEMVDQSIVVLRKAKAFPKLNDVEALVELTHLDLWQEAYYSVNKRVDTRDLEKLQAECEKLRNIIHVEE